MVRVVRCAPKATGSSPVTPAKILKMDELIDGKKPIFHVVMDRQKFGLSHDEAMRQDMASEYAVISDPQANGGLIVYAKYRGEWSANPWSTRFLIRVLLENSGIELAHNQHSQTL